MVKYLVNIIFIAVQKGDADNMHIYSWADISAIKITLMVYNINN